MMDNLPNAQKYLLYGIAAGVALFAVSVMVKGVKGTTRDLTAGIVGGAFDAVTGIAQGGYDALPDSIKPTNPDNVIYQGVNKYYEWIGVLEPGETIGGKIYDWTH